jgi:hypothetical protein
MGLLDDAIREHLDLKRRRGADPTEVEREEREVLGPVRRRGEEPVSEEPGLDHLAAPDDFEPDLDDEDDAWENGGAHHGVGAADPRSAYAPSDYDPF